MPHPSDKWIVPVAFCPIDGFALCLEAGEHMVSMIFDHVIVDWMSIRSTFWSRFYINVRHRLSPPRILSRVAVQYQVLSHSQRHDQSEVWDAPALGETGAHPRITLAIAPLADDDVDQLPGILQRLWEGRWGVEPAAIG